MEQSHKLEMANALRGDFARLRARGVATTFAPIELTTPVVAVVPTVIAPAMAPAPPVRERPAEQSVATSWLGRFLAAR